MSCSEFERWVVSDDPAERRPHVLLAHLVAGTALLRKEFLALFGELVVGGAEHHDLGDRPDPVLELELGEAARVCGRRGNGCGCASIRGPAGTVAGAAGEQDEADQDGIAPDKDWHSGFAPSVRGSRGGAVAPLCCGQARLPLEYHIIMMMSRY